jgi:tetratricopeptide (TPR) repeat protein
MLAHIVTFLKPSGKKKPDNAKINTYTTLIDFYMKNGYQKEARSTLEDLAQYYTAIGHDTEAKKTLQLAAQIGCAKKIDHLQEPLSDNVKQQRGEQPPKLQRDNHAYNNNIALKPDTDNSFKAARNAHFFDLESALTENDSSAFSPVRIDSKSPFLTEHVNAPQKPHAAIFREIKLNTENSPAFHYSVGIAHKQLHQFDDAIEEFAAALAEIKNAAARKIPTSIMPGDCYLQLVRCYDALNKRAKAAEYAGKALALNYLPAEQRLFLEKFAAGAGYAQGKRGICFFLNRQFVHIKNALFRFCASAVT